MKKAHCIFAIQFLLAACSQEENLRLPILRVQVLTENGFLIGAQVSVFKSETEAADEVNPVGTPIISPGGIFSFNDLQPGIIYSIRILTSRKEVFIFNLESSLSLAEVREFQAVIPGLAFRLDYDSRSMVEINCDQIDSGGNALTLEQVTLTFFNGSGYPFQIMTIPFGSLKERNLTLGPQENITVHTTIGEAWKIEDPARNCVGVIYSSVSRHQNIQILN